MATCICRARSIPCGSCFVRPRRVTVKAASNNRCLKFVACRSPRSFDPVRVRVFFCSDTFPAAIGRRETPTWARAPHIRIALSNRLINVIVNIIFSSEGACCFYGIAHRVTALPNSLEITAMKLAIRTVMLALAVVPALAFAGQGLTRAEVRAQLVQIEHAGYNPARKDIHYPQSIQQAEARLNSSQSTAQADTTGYGSAQSAGSNSGHALTTHAASRSIYLHH